MELALLRWERAVRVAAGVLGIGMAVLGIAALLARELAVWGVATLLLSTGALWCAFTPRRGRALRAMPFVVGGAMVILGGLGFAGTLRTGFVLAAIALGLVTLAVGTLAELPELLGGPRRATVDVPRDRVQEEDEREPTTHAVPVTRRARRRARGLRRS
jgi:hypothetical protein